MEGKMIAVPKPTVPTVLCGEPPVNSSRALQGLEMEKRENGNRALELADRYLTLRGGIKAN